MRNLLTFALALGLAGAASAQNNARVDQTGDSHDADVSQTYTAGAENSVNIVQTTGNAPDGNGLGIGHVADVDQIGGDNEVRIEQLQGVRFNNGNTSQPNFSRADVDQDGTGNTARIEQGASSSSNGGGFGASSKILQDGDDNTALATDLTSNADTDQRQIGDDNFASIRVEGQGTTVDQYQEGDDNDARVFGEGRNHDIDQRQIGDNNTATADHGNNSTTVRQIQEGDFNLARAETDNGQGQVVRQSQFGDFSESRVEIYGSSVPRDDMNATATTIQYSAAASIAEENRARIFQGTSTDSADNNVATIVQGADGAGVIGNDALIRQFSDANTARIDQMGSNNSAQVTQQ